MGIHPRSCLVTLSYMHTVYQPSETGLNALDELNQVHWSRLEHCYGKGVVSLGAAGDASFTVVGDLSRSLAALGSTLSCQSVMGFTRTSATRCYVAGLRCQECTEAEVSPIS